MLDRPVLRCGRVVAAWVAVLASVFLLAACGGGGGGGGTPAATVTGVQVTGVDATKPLVAGQTAPLAVTATLSDGSTQTIPVDQIAWSSSDTSVATIDSSGKITAIAPGSTTISGSYKGVEGSASLSVIARQLDSLELVPDKASVPAGASDQVTVFGLFNDNTKNKLNAANGVTLSSSDASIAKFSATTFGLLQTLKAGSVTVTATDTSGVTGTVKVTVTAAQLTGIMLSSAELTSPAGVDVQLTATGSFTDGTQQNVTSSVAWSVTGITGATVSKAGALKAPTPGTAKVTAALDGQTKSINITITAAALESVQVIGGNTSIAKGLTGSAKLRGSFSDGTQQDVTADSWKSADTSVLTIAPDGTITAVAEGTAKVTGTHGSLSASLTYTVTPAVVKTIAVTFQGLSGNALPAGLDTQATAEGTFSDGTQSDLTAKVMWSSNATSIATVNAAGTVHGVVKGAATITAKYQSVSGDAALQVTDAALQSVKITATDLQSGQITRAKGLTEQVSLVGTFSDGHTATLPQASITWAIADTSIASINSSGVVQFLKVGTTTLKGTSGSFDDSAQLTTTAAIPVSIEINGPASVPAGTTANYTAAVLFSDSSTASLTAASTWSSSNTSLATVTSGGSNSGQLKALSGGSVTITAKATQNGTALTGTKAVTVTPSNLSINAYSGSSVNGGLTTTTSGVGVQEFVGSGITNASVTFSVTGRDWKIVSSTVTAGSQVIHNTGDEGTTLAPGMSYSIQIPPSFGPRRGHWVMTVIDNAGNEVPFIDASY